MIGFFLLLFFLFQTILLFFCVILGNDPYERKISDEEQMNFLAEWNQKHRAGK